MANKNVADVIETLKPGAFIEVTQRDYSEIGHFISFADNTLTFQIVHSNNPLYLDYDGKIQKVSVYNIVSLEQILQGSERTAHNMRFSAMPADTPQHQL